MVLHTAQDFSFWESKESLARYAKMEYSLTDSEWLFISRASEYLEKPVSKISLLDLGCGGGRTTVPLHACGYKVTGVDISMPLVKALLKKFPDLHVQQGDAAALKFKKNSFDIVLFSHNSIDCLYPISARHEAFAEISRVLKPGGFFVFSSHNFNVIPFNKSTLWNVLNNLPKIVKLISSGDYYSERMQNGNRVQLFASSQKSVETILLDHGMKLVQCVHTPWWKKSILIHFIHSVLSWEITYLAKKV